VKADPDRIALWLANAMGIAVAAGWLASLTMNSSGWVYLPSVGLVVLIIATFPGGFFSPKRNGPTPLARIIAVLLLLVYVVSAPFVVRQDELGLSIAWLALVWLAATAMTWRSLRIKAGLLSVASGVAGLLVAGAAMLFGMGALRSGSIALGGAALLMGCAAALYEVEGLRRGSNRRLSVVTIIWVAELLGIAGGLYGSGNLSAPSALLLLILVPVGVAGLVPVVGVLRDPTAPLGIAFSVLGVGGLLFGVVVLRDGSIPLFGVAALLAGAAGVIFGIAVVLLDTSGRLFGVAALLAGAAEATFGIALVRNGSLLLIGVSFLLFGAAVLLGGIGQVAGIRGKPRLLTRLLAWLVRRDPDARQDDPPSVQPCDDQRESSTGSPKSSTSSESPRSGSPPKATNTGGATGTP